MAKKICKECGKTADTDSEKCELCGGQMISVDALKGPKPKMTDKFTGESDLNRESPGDFTPVAVRSIKPKVPNRTVLDIGKQEKRTFKQKMKTVGFILLTLALAFLLAMSIRHFFGKYNVKFTEENVQKRQTEQMSEQSMIFGLHFPSKNIDTPTCV